jgi:hypothetical protein
MEFSVVINWQKAKFFPFADKKSWYYVWFDNAYFQRIFWDGFWFYEDETKNETFKYVHKIQFFAVVPNIPTPKSEIGVEDFEDCFPDIFKNRNTPSVFTHFLNNSVWNVQNLSI